MAASALFARPVPTLVSHLPSSALISTFYTPAQLTKLWCYRSSAAESLSGDATHDIRSRAVRFSNLGGNISWHAGNWELFHGFGKSRARSIFSLMAAGPSEAQTLSIEEEKITYHQRAAVELDREVEAPTVFDKLANCILSTLSKRWDGFQIPSMVPCATEESGTILLRASSLSPYRAKFEANAKCSLLAARDLNDKREIVVGQQRGPKSKSTFLKKLKKHPGPFRVDLTGERTKKGKRISPHPRAITFKKGSECPSTFRKKRPGAFRVDLTGDRTKRRKRIRPRPRDITYKRGLESDTPEIGLAVPVPHPKAEEDKQLSANARFRQIEPSRELLSQIEKNLLGRRRLVEWRRAGFDPARTAPLDDVPESKDRRAPIQEPIFKEKLTFIAAAKTASSFPPTQYTEIAFAGRSNVGKSSLINALTRQWGVARTSDKPGLTQSINFFTLGSELCLVDLPGYGFAFAKEQVKEDWEELVKEYVASRSNLKRVCLLIDAKWGLKLKDKDLLQLMESSRTRYQIILTKTDVLPPLDLARRATQILQTLKDHRYLVQPLVMVSSRSGAGLPHLRSSLVKITMVK